MKKFFEIPEFALTNPLRKLKKKNLLSFNERSVRAMSVYGLNQEGYPDPTSVAVIANIAKVEKSICRWYMFAQSIPAIRLPTQKLQSVIADLQWTRARYRWHHICAQGTVPLCYIFNYTR